MVSVIIPVYNCAKYLRRCTNSILSQSYNDIECILVDDGSTDAETSKLCDTIKTEDERVKVIHKQNEGAERAREDGLNISNGNYIMFVDADDYLEKDIMHKCIQAIEKSGADMACFDYCLNENGKRGFQISKIEVIDQKEALRNMLVMKKLDGNMWCKLYHRNILEDVVFDTRRNCDFITISNIIKKAEKIMLLPMVGYHYSVIEGSQSRNNTCHPREEEYEKAAYELYEFCKYDQQISMEAESYWLYTLLYVCIKMEKDSKLSRKAQRFQDIKKTLRKEITRYYKNPYSDRRGKVQFLMCYFNLFRPIYMLYSLAKDKDRSNL